MYDDEIGTDERENATRHEVVAVTRPPAPLCLVSSVCAGER